MSNDIQELVAIYDKDCYLSSLFAPQAKHEHLFALYAFNIEITRIADAVSEPHIGLVRQQWWLDSIDGIYAGNTPDHPVAQALAKAVAFADLPKQSLSNLIIAREFNLYDDVMPSLNDLEGYLGETSSSIIQMASLILGENVPQAAGLAGVALGLAKVLNSGGKKFLPADMIQKLGEAETMNQLRTHARKRLAEARAVEVPKNALPAFLPACLTDLYLKNQKVSQLRRQFTLWRAASRNRF